MKTVKEIAVKLENKPGTLAQVCALLGANGTHILALSVDTEGDSGVMNFIAADPDRVVGLLESAGYAASARDVIAAEAPRHYGGLNTVLNSLKPAGVNVEHLYSFISGLGSSDATILVLGVDNLEAAHDALAAEWIRLYGDELFTS
jgi:hypothetical protein